MKGLTRYCLLASAVVKKRPGNFNSHFKNGYTLLSQSTHLNLKRASILSIPLFVNIRIFLQRPIWSSKLYNILRKRLRELFRYKEFDLNT